MFDFAISQNQKQRPTRLVLASRVLSVLAHIAALIILIENPGLLSTGMNRWLQQFPTIISSGAALEQEYRLVGMLPSRMQAPSQATLQKYLHPFDSGTPPVRVRWRAEEIAALGVDKPVPAVKPVQGTQEPKPPAAAAETGAAGGQPSGAASGGESPKTGAGTDGGTPGGRVVPLPPADATPKEVPKPIEVAAAPTSIPSATNPPPPPKPATPAQAAPKVFEDQKQAITTPGSGLFDTKGFPLGDYANIITDRIKGNWSIPSNLRNSRGQTTVIFFIDKNGNCSGLQVVGPSLSPSLDITALSAVIGSEPFPPLPKGFPGDRIGAKFVFSYNERQ